MKTTSPLRFIVEVVASFYDLDPDAITSGDRHHQPALARHVAVYLCRQLPAIPSYPWIARAVGLRDHTTAIAAVRKIAALREADAGVRRQLEELERRLGLGDAEEPAEREMGVWYERAPEDAFATVGA